MGQQSCDHGTDATTVGALVINSLDEASQASFRLSVGHLEPAPTTLPLDNALYMDFMLDGKPVDDPYEADQNKSRPAAILKMEYIKESSLIRELNSAPPDFRTALGGSNTEAANVHPKEGIEFKPPSDTTREGGQPHTVRVSMFSEFTGGYVKIGQGNEERAEYSKRQEDPVTILAGTHTFNSQAGHSTDWGRWNPELQRITLTDRHIKMRLDNTALEAFSFIAWIQRKAGGRGFAVRKVIRSVAPFNIMRLFERAEAVEQCWSWYIDGKPGLHFGDHSYTSPQFAAGAWSDGKLHLEAVVVNKTHVVMYQDLRVVRVQTLLEAYNSSSFPMKDCVSSALKKVSLEVGGSGLL